MVAGLISAIAVLAAAIIFLSLKIYVMRKSLKLLRGEFAQRIKENTNTPIGILSGDKEIRLLTAAINRELITLRKLKHKYESGDKELKNAVTNISHDLRTPLTAIYGYLDLIENETMSKKAEEYISIIRGRAENLKQLTEELFKYSIIMGKEPETPRSELSLNAVLSDTLLGFYAAFEENKITPEISIPENHVIRKLNKKTLVRIFDNIISNAIKYSEGDFKVILNDDGRIVFSNTAKDIDEVTAARLFDRFFTVESAHNSTGLGLSIAKILTEQSGGTITAEVNRGKLKIILYFVPLEQETL